MTAPSFDAKKFISTLPNNPGIYQMLGENGNVLYVGKARSLRKRVASYFSKRDQDIKTSALLKHVHQIEVIVTHSENEALLLESNLIKKYQPHYNILFRDDKSYPYIVITTDHPYPSIDFYRGSKKKGARYFGPYPHAKAVRETIHLIQKLFQLRTCNDHFFAGRTRPCLHYQIGLCSGSCAEKISAEQYKKNVDLAILFLEGKNDQIIENLQQQMEKAADRLDFETAARYRDQIRQLRQIQERQYVSAKQGDVDVIGLAIQSGVACIQLLMIRGGRILGARSYFPSLPTQFEEKDIMSAFLSQHYLNETADIPKEIITGYKLVDQNLLAQALTKQSGHKVLLTSSVRGERSKWLEIGNNSATQTLSSHLNHKMNMQERFENLQQILHLENIPDRIECFDISHHRGEETVASCVVFNIAGPVKNDYRRFIIKNVTPGNDVAAMEQVLQRRYAKLQDNEAKLPHIIIVDGGPAQLAVAEKVLALFNLNYIQLIGIAKGEGRKPGLETLYLPHQPSIHLPKDSTALHLLQQIRDEAHRFAITGHRLRRDKKRKRSLLENIPGIGAKRRRDLLKHFGGIQALNRASLEAIAQVPGISHGLAQRIFNMIKSGRALDRHD